MSTKVGIRYCGGCNPKYDRVSYVKELIKKHPEWDVSYMDDVYNAEIIYLINGCERACVRRDDLEGKNIIIKTNDNL